MNDSGRKIVLDWSERWISDPWVTQSGESGAKDLTTDLKLTRCPRSLATNLAAFPFCLAVPTARLTDNTARDRSECVNGILHCLPACVREVRPRERFRSCECEASSHCFSSTAFSPQKRREDARTRRAGWRLQSPATAERNTTGENFRKLATRVRPVANCENFHSIVAGHYECRVCHSEQSRGISR